MTEPKPCHHKRANHQHGTYACYALDRCRCYACAAARSAKRYEWIERAKNGEVLFVPASTARTHLIWLGLFGVGLRAVEKQSGIGRTALTEIRIGRRKRVKPETEAAILEVDESAASGGAIVECWPAQRRLRALMVMGWSMPRIVAEMGAPKGARQSLDLIMNGQTSTCNARTLRGVVAVFDGIWDKPPSEEDWRERISVSRSKGRAFREGWAPPMAWDDIDDPTECPNVGTVEKGVDLDEIDWLVRQGETLENAARRLHTTVSAVEKARSRAKEKGEQDEDRSGTEDGRPAACA